MDLLLSVTCDALTLNSIAGKRGRKRMNIHHIRFPLYSLSQLISLQLLRTLFKCTQRLASCLGV